MYSRRINVLRLSALLVSCSFLLNSLAYARGFGAGGFHGVGGGFHDMGGFHGADFAGGFHDFGGDHFGADHFAGDRFGGDGFDHGGDFANHADWGEHGNGIWQRDDHGLQPIATDGGFSRFANHPNYGYGNYNHFGNNTYNINRNEFVNNGNIVRGNFDHWGAFDGNWWGAHPGCWYGGWPAGYCWSNTSWMMLAPFLGMTSGMMLGMGLGAMANSGGNNTTVVTSPPVEYEYGNNIYYNGGNVYYGSQPVGTAAQYYDQAYNLAMTAPPTVSSATASLPKAKDWKPFGVFSLVDRGQTDSTTLFQLAVNKDGIIRGNYYNTLTEETKPISGALDKKSMRACWSVKGSKNVIYDTGVANLLENQSPILVHFGKEKTEQMMLVRLQPQQAPQQVQTKTS